MYGRKKQHRATYVPSLYVYRRSYESDARVTDPSAYVLRAEGGKGWGWDSWIGYHL